MPFSMYLGFMGVGSVLAWGSWSVVIFQVNPDEAGFIGLLLFYLTLLIALVGTFTLFGIFYRAYLKKRHHVLSREVRIAFRHAVFLSGMGVACLALSVHGWFRWWVFLLMLGAIAAIEYVVLVIQEGKRT
jgi:hypothetical protein